jgi:hypothetical protein
MALTVQVGHIDVPSTAGGTATISLGARLRPDGAVLVLRERERGRVGQRLDVPSNFWHPNHPCTTRHALALGIGHSSTVMESNRPML